MAHFASRSHLDGQRANNTARKPEGLQATAAVIQPCHMSQRMSLLACRAHACEISLISLFSDPTQNHEHRNTHVHTVSDRRWASRLRVKGWATRKWASWDPILVRLCHRVPWQYPSETNVIDEKASPL